MRPTRGSNVGPATFDVGVAVMVAACLGALALRNVRGGAMHAIG